MNSSGFFDAGELEVNLTRSIQDLWFFNWPKTMNAFLLKSNWILQSLAKLSTHSFFTSTISNSLKFRSLDNFNVESHSGD